MNSKSMKLVIGLIALSLSMFIVTLDTTITNIALPTITNYFNSTLLMSNWVSTVYVLVLSVLIIPASKLGDQFGRKKFMLIGILIFGIGSALCGLSESLNFLIAVRVFQGIGGAIVTPIMIPLSIDLFGKEKAGKAVGIIGAVTAVAAAAGPPVGGLLIKFFDWKAIFFVNVPIAIITFILILICFEESYDTTISKKIDLFGMIFLSLGLFQITFVLLKGYDYGWLSKEIILLIIGSLISFIIFFFIEKKIKEPLIEFDLFHELTFTASSIVYLICGFTIVCSSLILNFFLQDVRNYTTLNSAYIIMFMSLTVIISMPLGNKLAQKFSYKYVIFSGVLLMSLGVFCLYKLNSSTSNFTMIIYMMILGFGFGFSCLSIVSAVQFIPQTKSGIGSGIVNAMRQIGTCIGIALLVGVMTHNVNIAKKNIEANSIKYINQANISNNLKKIINLDIKNSLQDKSLKQSDILKNKIKKAISNCNKNISIIEPNNNYILEKLYSGTQQLLVQLKGNNKYTIYDRITGLKNSEFANCLEEIVKGISLEGQIKEIKIAENNILNEKNKQLDKAFNNTFLLAAIIILISSLAALFTDKNKLINK